MTRRVWVLFVMAVLAGCFHLEPGDVRRDAVADSVDAGDGTVDDRLDAPTLDAAGALDATKTTDVPAMDALDATDMPAVDGGDVVDAFASPDAMDAPEAPSDVCTSPKTVCGANCVNLQNDLAHCGACGTRCSAPANAATTCMAGVCGFRCNAGFADCDGDATNGCEVNTNDSDFNCGRCGARCPTGAHCEMGTCGSCPTSAPTLCGSACADLRTTAAHCGRCGNSCLGLPNTTAGNCSDGVCGLTCATGFSDCDGDVANGCEYRGTCAPCTEGWRPMPDGPRGWSAACAWTGRELLVWGGIDGRSGTASGSRYDPVRNVWVTMAPVPLEPRAPWTEAWTGTELLLWGGNDLGGPTLLDGARYNPTTDRWTTMATAGAPLVDMSNGVAVWTGSEMVVWGGGPCSTPTATGSRYDPVADRWRSITRTGAPRGRQGPAATWTGSEVFLWGGLNCEGGTRADLADGARYDPVRDVWSPISAAGAPEGRSYTKAVWTGSEVLIWGGVGASGYLATGGRYDPRTDRWRPMTTAGAPSPRRVDRAIWTDSALVIWGGYVSAGGANGANNGAAYDPVADRWRALPSSGVGGRFAHCAAWTGSEVIIQGGLDRDGDPAITYSGGARYTPPSSGLPRVMCGATCINVQTDANNCGSCGRACAMATNTTATCVAGVCRTTCNAGFVDCDGTMTNGCEVDTRTSAMNCGACGARCAVGACISSTCLTQRSCGTAGTPGCGLVGITGSSPFTMGAAECSTTPNATCARGGAPPQARVTVDSFALDAYEVTVARFNAYWAVRASERATVRSAPIRYPSGQTIAWSSSANTEPARQNGTFNWLPTSSIRDAHPMNGIDWWMAQEFCVWDGGTLASDPRTGRLPTEAEWEFAARGRSVASEGLVSGRVYPWGDAAPGAMCDRGLWNGGAMVTSCAGVDGGVTRRVGGFAATGGLFDLAGSVTEWTADNYAAYPSCWVSSTNPLCNTSATGDRVRRGGSWGVYTDRPTEQPSLRAASRESLSPTVGDSGGAGFRCARSTP